VLDFDRPADIRKLLDEGAAGISADEKIKSRILAGRRRKSRTMLIPAMAAVLILLFGLTVVLQSTSHVQSAAQMRNLKAGGGTEELSGPPVEAIQANLQRETEEEASGLSYNERSYSSTGQILPEGAVGEALTQGKLSKGSTEQEVELYAIADLPVQTAVAAKTDDGYLMLQRTSGSDGVQGDDFETTFGIRDKVVSISKNGQEVLTGEAARDAANLLLEEARFQSAEDFPGEDRITFTLSNGASLQLTASEGQIIGCGTWEAEAFLNAIR
jgi:hypothetical protein